MSNQTNGTDVYIARRAAIEQYRHMQTYGDPDLGEPCNEPPLVDLQNPPPRESIARCFVYAGVGSLVIGGVILALTYILGGTL